MIYVVIFWLICVAIILELAHRTLIRDDQD